MLTLDYSEECAIIIVQSNLEGGCMMKITKWEFERELESLINAALAASSKETARRYLIQAENKIDGYSDIDYKLQRQYRDKIRDAERKLGL